MFQSVTDNIVRPPQLNVPGYFTQIINYCIDVGHAYIGVNQFRAFQEQIKDAALQLNESLNEQEKTEGFKDLVSRYFTYLAFEAQSAQKIGDEDEDNIKNWATMKRAQDDVARYQQYY